MIDAMTLLDYEELVAYWSEHPPLHLLAAAYLGIGAREKRSHAGRDRGPAAKRSPDLGSLLSDLGPGFGAGDVHAGLDPVVLDFSELKRRVRAAR